VSLFLLHDWILCNFIIVCVCVFIFFDLSISSFARYADIHCRPRLDFDHLFDIAIAFDLDIHIYFP